MNQNISTRVRDVVSREFGIDESLLNSTSLNEMGVDSLDKLKLLMDLEEEFGVQLSDGCVSKLRTVNDAVAVIERRVLVTE